ncbi:hypothetical protein M378DRAFT_159996 [Amanita muscaria Koide BX008]|uniref:Uncharacterized protein n=1 Tax=Amanita muscaria (strain Koide BX008) TaxID=946122 RepID=A0A0C2WZ05_AMAMK|nr:hypothetical protein M378DRAFT_159996 [Amanita muscaria Koide BX008]
MKDAFDWTQLAGAKRKKHYNVVLDFSEPLPKLQLPESRFFGSEFLFYRALLGAIGIRVNSVED